MIGAKTADAGCSQYEFEIAIEAPPERVWKALIEETNLWWLPDFHMAGENSVVEFDPNPGGRGLVETADDGGGLLWYSVQYYLPQQFQIYLVGHVSPDFGGPSTSNLKLALVENNGGCILRVTDAHHGNVGEKSMQSLADGWTQLFGNGLKNFVETGRRQDG